MGYIGMSIFSICLYSCALVLAFITAIAVLNFKLYHWNLRFMLTNVSFTHCFVLTCALIEEGTALFEFQWHGIKVVNSLSSLCVWATIFSMMCLFCERLSASVMDKRYETMCTGIPWLGIILTIIDWTCAIMFAQLASSKVTTNITLAIIIISVNIIALFIFSFMPSLTYKRYMYAATQTKEFSLSQRYQTSQNYRSSKLLTKVVWCFGITSIMAAGSYILARITPYNFLFSTGYSLSLAAQTIAYPILMMCYEIKVRDFILCSRSQRNFIAQSINGRNLVIDNVKEQRDTYFEAYRKAWA